MRFKRFFIFDNYLSRLKFLSKKIKIKRLEKKNFSEIEVNYFWRIENTFEPSFESNEDDGYYIFGKKVNFIDINWHKDEFSGFEYPSIRIDKIVPSKWYNKGIEIKFPWELSRFYFGVNLAQKYKFSRDNTYYNKFKLLVEDWINQNKFLYGVNWISTMEAGIRAINLIIALNFFEDQVKNDIEFEKKISILLIQHAEFIDTFPEIYKNGITTNHTTACYAGLLFLSLSLKSYSKSKEWLSTSINGLETCLNNQVYEDGADFESSIPYHRLVLELFAFSAVAAKCNKIEFSENFYVKLFKMFEYTAAYIDKNGNAPQVGDNDSGRVLIFNSVWNDPYEEEHKHSYLLKIGQHIFNYEFKTCCNLTNNTVDMFLPKISKMDIKKIKINPKETNKSIYFENAGAYFLKNEKFDLMVSVFPLGQNGNGGHNHLDTGSFTLSINGIPFIVDPGTYCYSSNKEKRDKFRSYSYHNTLYNSKDLDFSFKNIGIWEMIKFYEGKVLFHDEKKLITEIHSLNDSKIRKRTFELSENLLSILDEYDGSFFSNINLNPNLNISTRTNDSITANGLKISITSGTYEISEYNYSPIYNISLKSLNIKFYSLSKLQIEISPSR